MHSSTVDAQRKHFFENIYEEFGDSVTFQFLMGLIYMNNAMFDAAGEFLKAVKHRDCPDGGGKSYATYYNVGVINECLWEKSASEVLLSESVAVEPAVKRLKQLNLL